MTEFIRGFRFLFISILAAILLPSMALSSSIDSCHAGVRYNLKQIESFSPPRDSLELLPMVKCILAPANFYVENPDSFLSNSFDSLVFEKTWKDRQDVIRLLEPFSKSAIDSLRLESIAALAYYNYPPSAQLLIYYPDIPLKAVLYAILKDSSATGWAIDCYNNSKTLESADPQKSLNDRIICLGLMYHIHMPAAIPFINEILKSESSEKIKTVATMVRNKIVEFHPDIK